MGFLYISKERINKVKKHPSEWEKDVNYRSDKVLISRINNNACNSTKTKINQIKNEQRTRIDNSQKNDLQVAKKLIKRYSTTLIKTTRSYNLILLTLSTINIHIDTKNRMVFPRWLGKR